MSNFGELTCLTLYCQSKRKSKAVLKLTDSSHYFPCAIGKNGQTAFKKEGDSKTPLGIYHPLQVFYRPDRTFHPQTQLPVTTIKPSYGWCDQPFDRNYNRAVERPYPASSETLWREDNLYNLIVVLDHNQCPRVQGRGSAIFMHVAKPDYSPTEGCIALSEQHLHQILKHLTPKTRLKI